MQSQTELMELRESMELREPRELMVSREPMEPMDEVCEVYVEHEVA